MAAVADPFPQAVEEFENDDRVSWDSVENKFVLVSDTGAEYEWNEKYEKWIEMVDESLIQAHQAAYFDAEANENTDDKPAEENTKKRKADKDEAKPAKEKKAKVNTSVYVTGIPTDATFDEIHDVFKKYGLIASNIDSETPRIKMYANDDGSFKGEALITYFRPESVEQAIYLSDDSAFRPGTSGNMRVQEADYNFKKVKEVDQSAAKGKRSKNDVEKIKRITNGMNKRLGDWGDEDPQQLEEEYKPANKFDKTVVVKRMFTLEQLKTDAELEFDIPEDIRDQAKEKAWGDVVNVTVFDQEEDGVVRIRFRDAESATKAVMGMDGRLYDGRQLEAYVPNKKEIYRKTVRDEEEEERRLEKYGRELEDAEGDNGQAA